MSIISTRSTILSLADAAMQCPRCDDQCAADDYHDDDTYENERLVFVCASYKLTSTLLFKSRSCAVLPVGWRDDSEGGTCSVPLIRLICCPVVIGVVDDTMLDICERGLEPSRGFEDPLIIWECWRVESINKNVTS